MPLSYMYYPQTDMLQSQDSSENIQMSNMNIQSQFEPATPQATSKRVVHRQSSSRILKRDTTPPKKASESKASKSKKRRVTSLNCEPRKNFIAIQFQNSKRSNAKGKTRNQELSRSMISCRLATNPFKSVLPSNFNSSRGKARSARFKKKNISQVSNLSKNSKKSKKATKTGRKESRAKKHSQPPVSGSCDLQPVYSGPLTFNDGTFQVVILQDMNKNHYLLGPSGASGGQLVQLVGRNGQRSEPLSLCRTAALPQSRDPRSSLVNARTIHQSSCAMDNTFNGRMDSTIGNIQSVLQQEQ